MDTKAAIIALLSVWGVGTSTTIPAIGQDTADTTDDEVDDSNPLLNKVWVRADTGASQAGPMQIFLADGTLVTDSCWEAYRLSTWHQLSGTAISWDENGTTINADIASLTQTELVLMINQDGNVQEQRFTTASIRNVTPDLEA